MMNHDQKIVQTAGRDALGTFAPEFAHYNDDVLFAENWNQPDIDHKTKSLVTLSVFMGRGIVDSSMKYHLETAKKNGVKQKEIAAVITHAAFYAGWPVAWAAMNMAKEVWREKTPAQTDRERFAKEVLYPISEPNTAFSQYFIGESFLAPISEEQVPIFHVTFSPACRNNWHIHHATSGGGQMLLCVGGRGWYQQEGKDAVPLSPGMTIHIPAGEKHWHGAQKDCWFSHLAIEVPGTDAKTEWCEPVDDAAYSQLEAGGNRHA